jgi:thiamine pyrophosphokinase
MQTEVCDATGQRGERLPGGSLQTGTTAFSAMTAPRVVIFANGMLPDLDKARGLVDGSETILCADGGTRHALALGLTPAMIVGDRDSLSEEDQRRISDANVVIKPYAHDKDQTDLELALEHALSLSPDAILIVGALGRRLDHTLGNLALLTDPRLDDIDCRLDDGVEEAWFCRDQCEIRGAPGDLVSLIPWGMPVTGVRTQGLRWPLAGGVLRPDKTLGISNEMLGESATVRIETGPLLVVHRRQ